MEYVMIGLRSLIALVFLISVASKLRRRRAFSEFVAATARLSPLSLTATQATRLAAVVWSPSWRQWCWCRPLRQPRSGS
jgi:hypothetical protein